MFLSWQKGTRSTSSTRCSPWQAGVDMVCLKSEAKLIIEHLITGFVVTRIQLALPLAWALEEWFQIELRLRWYQLSRCVPSCHVRQAERIVILIRIHYRYQAGKGLNPLLSRETDGLLPLPLPLPLHQACHLFYGHCTSVIVGLAISIEAGESGSQLVDDFYVTYRWHS